LLLNEGSGEALVNTATGQDLTVSFGSTVSWESEPDGPVLESDGTSTTGYVSLGTDPVGPLFDSDGYTVTFRYTFLETPASLEGMVTAASSGPYPFGIRYEASKVVFMHNANKLNTNLGSVLFKTFDFSAVWDPDVGQLFYIDGELDVSNSYTTAQTSTMPLYIHTGYNGTRVVKGNLHYLYIHDRPLPAGEIRRLHATPFAFVRSPINQVFFRGAPAPPAAAARRRIISKARPPLIMEKRPGMPPPWIEWPWTQPVGEEE
jgi:hypothetical protein